MIRDALAKLNIIYNESLKMIVMFRYVLEYIKLVGKYFFFKQLAKIIVVINVGYGLVWFCEESNKVQIHEYKISIDTNDPFILDSLSILLKYPKPGEKKINMIIRHTLNGEKILGNPPRNYFLRNGFKVDSVLSRVRVCTSILIDAKPLKSIEKKTLKNDDEYNLLQEGGMYNNSVTYAEYFFLDDAERNIPDKFSIFDSFTYNYYPNLLSLFNLQKRYVSVLLDAPLDKRKIRVEIDFKMPINVHSTSNNPDKQGFSNLVFDQKDNLTKLCSNGFTAIVETLPYEGIQTARNFVISAIFPIVLTYLWYLLVQLTKSLREKHNEAM